ncbi:glycoside hydrolase family 3 C-terminal domain-containing protein [Isoptericola croceus]|uniref:glycoside hydrolase family 3 C-terminal domain-containing protein n=1 Tax=Isoptericola croceus TaxID=3031406 RepID=UPI0023F67CFC|nr:glycoside hydrolase family 3 C-terminal domain-containing protein [Isoptericola croceus]
MDVPPFRDHQLSTPERARDLLSRLTREERVAMLHQRMPAVDRLGLAAFHTGCEALHGVAWLGRATVFPQPVGLAATWDTDLLRRIGDAVATEVRAKHAADPQVSLNVWAPVVNTLRHPGWGRNEEGYSEDPHVTGHLGAAYCRGLRGDHERVWKTAPTLKHFLAYNNESDRSSTSSDLTPRTLHEEELPAFRDAVTSGAVAAVMPSYNLVDGVPAHLRADLLSELRSWTDRSLAVVSDAAAPMFAVTLQRAYADRASGNAAMLRAGVDSFTDDDADSSLTVARIDEALGRGLLTMDDVDRAVLRLLELRLLTGELDADGQDPYAGIGADAIDLPEHRALAREAATRAVVVLRNDAAMLPLDLSGSVAVVGPLADVVLTDWYSGTPPYAVTVADALRERLGAGRVVVADGADVVALRAAGTGRYVTVTEEGSRVVAEGVAARPDSRFEVTDWGDGVLTLRSQGTGGLLTGASWLLRADADRVGGWEVQESFRRHVHADGTWSLLHLGSGRWVRTQRGTSVVCADGRTLDDAERFGVRMLESGAARVAEAAAACDAVVVAVGNDPHLNGRETQDRPHLYLPGAAVEIWRAAVEANPRAVLSLVSSYPYVLGPGVDDAETIVWSSHGGQELGHGLIDVLVGAVEPTGRLAQTWPARPEQAGDIFDYDTRGQQVTYRHLPDGEDGTPAFAFGHGLTFAAVSYQALGLSAPEVVAPPATRVHPPLQPDAPSPSVVTARVRVRNDGTRPAEELVQVYSLGCADVAVPTPVRLLLGYRRVRLEPGQELTVEVAFDVARLAVWRQDGAGTPDGALEVQRGSYELAAGASSVDLPARAILEVVEPTS